MARLDEISARTLGHYDAHADAFWEGTRDHDVSQNYARFLAAIEGEAPLRILDFGCGPGRDVAYFRKLGHHVVGLDGSLRFVEMARARTGCEILHQDFLKLSLEGCCFDGIFANASLFHVPTSELGRVLLALANALVPRGVLFSSNPRGSDTEGFSGERFGAFHTLETWKGHVVAAGFEAVDHYYRPEGKPHDEQPWLATIWRRASTRGPSLGDAFEAGARHFDAGAFFEAHEVWEERWRIETDEASRRFLQGLIQIAAALHKLLVMRAPDAASRLFEKGLRKLDALPPGIRLDLVAFRERVARCAGDVADGRFDTRALPMIGNTRPR